jgi:hypothetical protein
MNTGLAGYAAMTAKSLREAQPEAVKHINLITSNLWREWERRSHPLIQQIARVENQYQDTTIGPVLSQFLRSSEHVVRGMLTRSASTHSIQPRANSP